ncbi:MAG: SIR2 family protein [Prolixibacteraceae bacterium]|jgi:hypothetical protein|nr:SIR2 family protein [Prolixibacteraceae bacterium]
MGYPIYILGAGFSKAFSEKMPTLNDLSISLLDDKYKEDLPNLYEFIYKRKEYLIHLNANIIEAVSNILFSNNLCFTVKDNSEFEVIKFEFLQFIHLTLIDFQIDKDKEELLKKFIFEVVDRHGKIITFNYDLIISDFIRDNLTRTSDINILLNDHISEMDNFINELLYGFHEKNHPRKKNGRVDILKLHGSFDWYKLPGIDDFDLKSITKITDGEKQGDFLLYNVPVYIPMAHSKEYYFKGSLFPSLWQKAYYWLKECDEIIFIGYGFPETDVVNFNFFLQFKDKIKDIVVMNDHNLKKLTNIFGEKVKSFGALKYIETL